MVYTCLGGPFLSFLPSLRVNLDMGKIVYSWVIRRDSKIPGTVVRSSTIPEQLGRISYLLTDKTGECLYKGQREAGWGPADLGPLSGAGRGGGSCFLPRYWMKRGVSGEGADVSRHLQGTAVMGSVLFSLFPHQPCETGRILQAGPGTERQSVCQRHRAGLSRVDRGSLAMITSDFCFNPRQVLS